MSVIQVSESGGVVSIRLNRPQVRNAFNDELVSGLSNAFRDLPAKARVVVLSGEGPSFCAGADLDWMRRSAQLPKGDNERHANALAQLFESIDQTPAVLIGLLHGAAMGGGVGLLACCDLVIAASDA